MIYTCSLCHETYDSPGSNDEAWAEYAACFPTDADGADGAAIVCDDCYKTLMGRHIQPH